MRNRLLNASSPLVLFGRFATAEIHVVQYNGMYVQRSSSMRLNQLGILIIANSGGTRRAAFTLGSCINIKPLTGDGIQSDQGSCNNDAKLSDYQAPPDFLSGPMMILKGRCTYVYMD